MSRMSPQPKPISCAIQMNLMLRGIEAHHLCCDGIYGYLIGAGKNDVLGVPAHCSGAWAVAGEGAVGYGKDAGVNLLLYLQAGPQGFRGWRSVSSGGCG